jgi:integrase/recombinase XerD
LPSRAATVDADTVNRELSVVRAAISWWRGQGWLQADPTVGLVRRPAPPDRTRALTREQISALFALDVGLRDKTYWRLLYETAARAEEILALGPRNVAADESLAGELLGSVADPRALQPPW